jgi:hypothetical protein
VSEESNTDTPGTAASDGEPVVSPEATPKPGWLYRLRRTSLRVRIAAAAVAASVIAASVFIVVSSSPSSPGKYTTLPAPCDQIGRATLAGYLPNPTGTSVSEPETSTIKQEACRWSSTADGQVRTVVSGVVIFSSSEAISQARQYYDSSRSILSCHCAGTSVGTRSVTGLGDEATAVLVTAGPDADEISTSGGPIPGITLLVLSRNAGLTLSYSVTAAATGMTLPADGTNLTWLVSMARGILAGLARPAAIPAAPLSAPPHYAGSHDPCRLMNAATLARYAPGATLTPGVTPAASASPSGAQTSTCSWSSGSVLITLSLNVFPDAARAEQGFDDDVLGRVQKTPGLTVTGSRWLSDLGDGAAAITETRTEGRGTEVFVHSGNVELDYWYAYTTSPPPDSATLLPVGIALARAGLAALASPNASAYPQGPMYAKPDDVCTLVKASTLARYAPGAAVDRTIVSTPAPGGLNSCYWLTPGADMPNEDDVLSADVTIYATVDGAEGGFQFAVQNTQQDGPGRTQSVQEVKGLGEHATVIFQTGADDTAVATLCIWSGNAEIETTFSDLAPPIVPALSRATLLAADLAMARDVLADLPRS